MDRPPHDYAAAMAFAQQQQQQQQQQQPSNLPGQQFPFPPQHQQFPPSVHGSPFLPPHPSVQQYPFPRQQQPQSLHPHLLHHQQQQPGPSFPPHGPPHMGPPFPGGPYDSAPPPVPPPHDPELQKRIDKLVEYVAKNGPEFEAMVCEKEHGNPAYGFLFGGEGHGYYRYKLYLFTRPPGPFGAPFPSGMPGMHPPPMNSASASGPMMGGPQMHQPTFPHFYDQQQPHGQPFVGHGRPDYDRSPNMLRGLSGPLPYDVGMELNNVLVNLTGTKESIKSAKAWFMQRSAFAPALTQALRERMFALDDSEKQLHIIYLANDILFDSFQRRVNPHELDNEALAFKPVLGAMLARVYHHPQNKDENQSRLQKIVQFWASKEVYDQETIHALEGEMLAGPSSSSFLGNQKEMPGTSVDPSGAPHQAGIGNLPHWQQNIQNPLLSQEQPDRHGPPIPSMIPGQQFLPHTIPPVGFPGSIPLTSSVPPLTHQTPPNMLPQPATNVGEKLPTYPLFPPGLIPGMVKKQQIGSGVPYSPMSPLDIPTAIPPSDTPESELLDRVSKFFKEIGEVNPSEGPMSGSEGRYEDDYERDSPVRKGGACIPPPPNLQSGTGSDTEPASFGSGRLGLGASSPQNNEGSQYDDVYSSYRKNRSSNYHTSMSVRASSTK